MIKIQTEYNEVTPTNLYYALVPTTQGNVPLGIYLGQPDADDLHLWKFVFGYDYQYPQSETAESLQMRLKLPVETVPVAEWKQW